MFKIAGWIISVDAAKQWAEKHPQAFAKIHQPWWTIPTIPLRNFVRARRSEDANFPVQEGHLTNVDFPKTSPENFGTCVCILVRRVGRRRTEMWNQFDPLLPSEADMDIAKFLSNDGLVLGEWVTIPDPWQEEWPFEMRYPGRMPAPDPSADSDSDDD